MKGYRYNTNDRSDRKYNNCGMEKNPNAIKFYATNMEYADNYKYIINDDGEQVSECSLEVVEIDGVNLFNMSEDFKSLTTYQNYISEEIGRQRSDYTEFMNDAKSHKERKMWEDQIAQLDKREESLISTLVHNEFQPLSDFERQNELVDELKSLGFDGYITKNEIAIF